MKKVLIGILVLLIIAGVGTGVYFRSNIIDFINDKMGNGNSIVLDTYNLENNASMKPFLDVQKSILSKKDYKNFLNNINQQVTYDLKEIAKVLPGYDTLSNVLFIEDETTKTIDFINMNNYDKRLEPSYHAFIWVGIANETNPNWNGYFQENEFLISSITEILSQEEVEETQPIVESEPEEVKITLSEFQMTEEYNEIISLLNDEVELEDNVITSMKSTFGDNYDKVFNLLNEAKKNVTLNTSSANMLGENNYGIGYAGKVVDDTFYIVTGQLKEDNTIGDNYDKVFNLLNEAKKNVTLNTSSANMLGENNYGIGYAGKVVDDTFYIVTGQLKEDNTIGDEHYVLFRINTSGNYDDYSNGIIMLAELVGDSGSLSEIVLPPKSEVDENEEDESQPDTEEQTEEETTVAPQVKESKVAESEQSTETTQSAEKKSPIDLFDELMNSSEASTEENAE